MAVTEGPSLSLADVLLREKIISGAQLNSAVEEQRQTSHSLGRVLVDKGFINEALRMAVLKRSLGFDIINLKTAKFDPMAVALIPAGFAEKHRIVPVRQEGGAALVVAMEDPSDLDVIDAVKTQVGMKVKAYVASAEDVTEAIRTYYHGEPPAKEPAAGGGGRGKAFQILSYTFMPVMCFAPLVIFGLALKYHPTFQQSFYSLTTFDIGLYTLLGWGLWSIIFYEINALLFQKDETETTEEAS